MTVAEKKELIEKIFSDKQLFEKEVLNVTCNSDRIEIMDILAKRIVRVLLREELSFLYMKDLENFKFSLIRNILFREIANEWVSYAVEVLILDQEDATEMLQEKKHALFLLELIKEYFRQYKVYFTQEIADTFIELIENMPSPTTDNTLIRTVLKSGFVKNQNISIVYSYSQLWSRVRNAHDTKKEKIAKMQIKISEEKDIQSLKKLELKEEILESKPLAFFDEALLRLRNTMVQFMMKIEVFKNQEY